MTTVQSNVERLRYIIANIVERLEIWDTLPSVIGALGFQYADSEGLGKRKYLLKIMAAADQRVIVSAAKLIMESYPGKRGTPSAADLQHLQDALWWIEGQGLQKISNVTRYQIAESLERVPFWGRLTIREFFYPILPAVNDEFSLPEVGADGLLYTGLSWMPFHNWIAGNQSKSLGPTLVSAAEFLRLIGIAEWPDERLILFIERMINPEVQSLGLQKKLVEQLDTFLLQDNFECRQEGTESGAPLYRVRRKDTGTVRTPKYIIFASIGPKPDIIIDDALDMDIRIIRNADKCIVYDQPPPQGDLTWQALLEWWSAKKEEKLSEAEIRRDLGKRLRASLQSEPERILFDTYFKIMKPQYGRNLPALLPQVYLHYDPRHRSERQKPVLTRQRMDFLLLLRNAARIVIEIDGVQHFSDDSGKASPSRYAEMVSEDRRIRILGYDVYRFGGAEFKIHDVASITIVAFFRELFARHKILPS